MAPLLGWSAEQTAAEVAHYRDVVALSRQFQARRPEAEAEAGGPG
jgi:hypothetical protein